MELIQSLIGINITLSDVTVMLNTWVAWPIIVVNSYVYYKFFQLNFRGNSRKG